MGRSLLALQNIVFCLLIGLPVAVSAREECATVSATLRKLNASALTPETRQLLQLEASGFVVTDGSRLSRPANEQELLSSILSGRMIKIGSTDPTDYGLAVALELLDSRIRRGEPLDAKFFERLDRSLLSAKPSPNVAPDLSADEIEADFANTKRRSGQSFDRLSLPDQRFIDFQSLEAPGAFQTLHEVARLNELALARMNTIVPSARPGRIAEANAAKIESIYQGAARHPSAKVCAIGRYQSSNPDLPKNLFCYGRAYAGHIEALRQGVSKDSIRKVFLIGKPDNGKMQWNYHVGISIRGNDGKWWVLDPDAGKPMPVEDWYKMMSARTGTGRSRFYFTDPRRLGPHAALPRPKGKIGENVKKAFWKHDAEYNNYFHDMMWEFSTAVRAEMGRAPVSKRSGWD